MTTVNVFETAGRRALVSREAARELEPAIRISANDEITFDFRGVEAVSPSFVDELLLLIESTAGKGSLKVTICRSPTRLSSKFEALARAHEAEVQEIEPGTWVITWLAAAPQ
jgi:hypothetical protein